MSYRVHRYRIDGEYIEAVQIREKTPISFFGKCEMLNAEEIVCQVHPNMMNVYSVIVLDRSDYSIKRVLRNIIHKIEILGQIFPILLFRYVMRLSVV